MSGPQPDRRVRLAESIARRWNEAEIRYAVVNGLSGYPSRIGRDLDLVIGVDEVPAAVAIASKAALEHRFDRALFRWSAWGLYQLVLIDLAGACALPIDLMCTRDVWRAKLVELVAEEDLVRIAHGDAQLGPFRISVEGTQLKTHARALLCGDTRRIKNKSTLSDAYQQLSHSPAGRRVLGEKGLRLLAEDDPERLRARFPQLMYALQGAWILRHPLKAAECLTSAMRGRLLRRLLNPADSAVVFADHPREAYEALSRLRPEFKAMFIDIRPGWLTGRPLTDSWRKRVTWRETPTSEFIIFTAIEGRCDIGNIGGFDLILRPTSSTVEGFVTELKTQIFEWLSDRYPISTFGEIGSLRTALRAS